MQNLIFKPLFQARSLSIKICDGEGREERCDENIARTPRRKHITFSILTHLALSRNTATPNHTNARRSVLPSQGLVWELQCSGKFSLHRDEGYKP